ncbi:hypothetical protein NECID01_1244 [Nematocida sp. AWRm77]|nr:hypothetical protein NECID01_1244 [Nematocida sp. AWRm77]
MEIKAINNCLETKLDAPLEDRQSANPVDLVSSTHILNIDDVESSKDSGELINSSTAIEEPPKRKWEEIEHEFNITLFLSTTIFCAQLTISTLWILSICNLGELSDGQMFGMGYILRNIIMYFIESILFFYVFSMIVNYIKYILEMIKEKGSRYYIYMLGFSLMCVFNSFLVVPSALDVGNIFVLWVLCLVSVGFMITSLIHWRLHASFFFPPVYAKFIKMISWEIIVAVGVMLVGCSFSYIGFICNNANTTFEDIQSKLDNLSETNFTLSLAGYTLYIG